MNKNIRIMLVEHSELVSYGLRHMLEPEEDMEVVGDCANAEEAFSKMSRLCPDILLMDIQMPGMDGIEATRSLRRNGLDYAGDVIILAESADNRVDALEAGAADYLLKDITCEELTHAIRQVYWSKQSPGFVEEAIELVVPPPANAAWLLTFMCQLEETLHDNHADIMHTVGSWDWGTVITVILQSTRLSTFLNKLGNMPDVEKVEEEPLTRGAVASFPKKLGVLPRPIISPNKRIRVTLKETGMAGRKFITALK